MKQHLAYVLLLCFAQASAQEDTISMQSKTYKAVIQDSSGKNYYGRLLFVTDSTTVLGNRTLKNQKNGLFQQQAAFPYRKMESIVLQRKGSVGRGMLWGGISGALLGVVIGFMSGDDTDRQLAPGTFDFSISFTAREKAAGYGILGGIGGMAMGGIIGALAKKTFIIGGKKENHDLYRQSVLEMTNSGKSRH